MDKNLAAFIQAALDLARFVKAHATEEELSTHVEVSFDDYGAAGTLNLAERVIALYEHGPIEERGE